jgi:hypothetical protein
MTTLRKRFKQGFTTVPNKSAEDKRLSLKARGLLVYLLAKPDNWEVRSRQIAAEVPDGRDAVQSALRELGHYGYYRLTTERRGDGSFDRITDISDTPVDEPGWVHTIDLSTDLDELVCETCRADVGLPRNKKRARWPVVRTESPGRDVPAPGGPAPDNPARDVPAVLQDHSNKAPSEDHVLERVVTSGFSVREPRARALVVPVDPVDADPVDRDSGAYAELARAITENFGSTVSTELDDAKARTVVALVIEHGVPALIQRAIEIDARFAHPPNSMRPFIKPWQALPPWCGQCDVSRWIVDSQGVPTVRCPSCHPDSPPVVAVQETRTA